MAKDWRSSVAEANKPAAATDPAEQARRRARRNRKIFGVLVAMLTLIGGAFAAIFLLAGIRQPYFLTVPVVEYQDPLWPVNPLAEQDSDALAAFFLTHDKGAKAIESQTRNGLVKQLDDLRQDRRNHTVVFHLCALARTVPGKDGQPNVCVIPAEAGPDVPPDRLLPLDDVLDAMRACPAPHKLLILDLARQDADPRVGVLANDVADSIQTRLETLQQQEQLPFAVLTACARDQRSLFRDDYRVSALAYFLAEGCRGKADGLNPEQRKNGRVSLRELHAYVERECKQWAPRFRNASQTPLLFGQFDDFDMVILDSAKADLPAPPPPAAIPYPDWLLDGWRLRDAWWDGRVYRDAPRAFLRLEAALLRAEQRWRGGLGLDEKRARAALDVVEELKQEVKQASETARPQPRSLAQEVARGQVPNADTLKFLQEELLKPEAGPVEPKDPKDDKEPPPPVKEPGKKRSPQEIARSMTEKWKGKRPFDKASAAIAFVDAARADELTTDRLEVLRRLLEQAPDRLHTRYAETLCLHRLLELRSRIELSADKLKQAIRITRECEEALAADPRILFWFRARLEDLSTRRSAAEASIFQEESVARSEAGLKELDAAGQSFRAVLEQVAVLQKAFLDYDEMMIRLPGYTVYLAEHPRADLPAVDRWVKAVERLADLRRELLQPPGDGAALTAAVGRIQILLEDIDRDRAQLRKPFTKEAREDLERHLEDGKPIDYLELLARLDSPRVFAAERARIWTLTQAFAQNLKTRPTEDLANEFQRAAMRSRMSIAMLQLGGFDGANLLRVEWERINKNGKNNSAAWAPLAERLRIVWSRELPEQLAKTKDPAAADLLLRVFSAWDKPVTPVPNPGGRLRQAEAKEFARFLADLYQKQLALAPPNSPAESYYAESERTCRAAAGSAP
jgi:hypothetical protein